MDAVKSTFVLYLGHKNKREKRHFLSSNSFGYEASRDVALIGEAQKTKYF